MKITTSKVFDKNLKRLSKKHRSLKKDYANLIDELEKDPRKGTDLGDGLRKIRLAIKSKGKGKSGGARVITYTDIVISTQLEELYLVLIWDKSETENISKQELLDIVDEIINK